jgi:hypothetical protein
MTEKEWLTCEDPRLMLRFLAGNASDRKVRLFACAGCRRVWKSLDRKPIQQAVEAAEQFADGAITTDELKEACNQAARSVLKESKRNFRKLTTDPDYAVKAYKWTFGMSTALPDGLPTFLIDAPPPDEETFRTLLDPALLRDIFGNPFRPVSIEPRWLTSDVVALARGIYDDRAFGRLPILADALTDAGCEDADLLAHCRSDGSHARGCWVVDLLLGKS